MPILPWGAKPGTSGGGGSGTVTSVSVVSANGLAGTVASATTTPAITLSTSITGILSGNSTAIAGITTSAGIAAQLSDETGTGALVFGTSPTLATAVLGSSTATTQSPADNSTKVATTAYVDNAVLGQDFKQAVTVATTGALTTYTYNNGSSGSGATITLIATGVIAFDGTNLTLGMRVLVKNEASTNTPNNGIYTVTVAGALGVALVLTRATDFDQSSDIDTGDSVFVTSGTTQGTTTWAYNGANNPTMGTTNITFAQTAGQGSFTGGNGITITGTSIAIDTSVTVDKTTAQTLTNKTLTSPTLTTPAIGAATGTSLVLTNTSATGLAVGANGTTNPTLAVDSSTATSATGLLIKSAAAAAGLALSVTSSGAAENLTINAKGTGTIGVGSVSTGAVTITPATTITGALTLSSTVNKVTITAPGTSATLTLITGSSLITAGAFALTLTSTAATNSTLPAGTHTLAGLDVVQTWSAAQSFNSSDLILKGSSSGTTTLNSGATAGSSVLTLPVATDTLTGKATTDTLTNKSIDGSTNTFTNIPASGLSTSALLLGYTQITATFSTASTSAVQVTSLTATVTIPAGGRKTKVTVYSSSYNNNSASLGTVSIWDGTVGTGTQLNSAGASAGTATFPNAFILAMAVVSPAAGSKTYNAGFAVSAGTGNFVASATSPAFILVEAV